MAMTGGTAYLVRHEKPDYGKKSWYIDLYVYVKQVSQSVDNNQTTLSLGMYVVAPYDIGAWDYSSDSYVGTATSGNDCKTFNGAIPKFNGTRWLVENQNVVVTHNTDGTKTATIYWKWGVNSPWGQYVNPSGSFTVNLTAIPRASTPTLSESTVTMGDKVTIYTNRKANIYTCDLYLIKGSDKIVIKKYVYDSFEWTVGDLAYLCNNATSFEATVSCETFTGSDSSGWTWIGTKSVDITINVPGKTIPSFPNGDVIIGGGNPITTSAKSSNFSHLIKYSFNGKTGNVTSDKVKSGIVWWTPYDLANAIKDSTYGEGTITCETYNGTALVGTSDPISFKAIVPDNSTTKPSFDADGFVLTPSSSLPSAFNGLYIRGKTGVKAEFEATSTYSTISSYKLSVEGRAYTGNPATSNVITKDGNIEVIGTAIDTRGYSKQVTKDIPVIPYSIPSIVPYDGDKEIVCERCDQNGLYTPSGIYLHIRAKRAYSSVVASEVQKNFCDLKYRYKATGGTWSDEYTLLEGTNISTDKYEGIIPDVVAETDKSYLVQLIVEDTIGEKIGYDFSIPTDDVTLHLSEGGYGVAVGKYSESTPNRRMFEVAENWDFVINGESVEDFVVEYGTSGIWEYRKWNSGIAECWGVHTQSDLAVNKAWGSLFESSGYVVDLPVGLFVDTPQFNITLVGSGEASGTILETYSLGSNLQSPYMCAIRPTAATIGTLKTSIVAYGRWK